MTDGNAPVARGYPGSDELRFGYTNWKNRTSYRRVRPISIRYGQSKWHPRDGWLMLALDLDKNDEREFSMRDMVLVEPADARPLGIAQGSQEPVAWTNEAQLGFLRDVTYAQVPMAMWASRADSSPIPLYAAPVAQQQPELEDLRKANQILHVLLTNQEWLLVDAQRIIAEYKAGTIAGARTDVAAHGLPGARGRGEPALDPAEVWENYISEVDPEHRSPQGALAFGFAAALAFSSTNQPPPKAWLEAKAEIDAGWPDDTPVSSTPRGDAT